MFLVFVLYSPPSRAQLINEIHEPSGRMTNQWWDTHPKRLGFDWTVGCSLESNYLWRGLNVGGLSLQPHANVSYEGAYIDVWWNLGATDWTFYKFNPELDLSIGFSRWGLTLQYTHMYYFDRYSNGETTCFFDFKDPQDGVGGINTEWKIGYKISSKFPLSVMWATRTWGKDGYLDNEGKRQRAYSTYIELGYDFNLPNNYTIQTKIGMTPWRSIYTSYQGNFAVNNISIKGLRTWKINRNITLDAHVHVMLNTWNINKHNLIREIGQCSDQKLNLNLGLAIYYN